MRKSTFLILFILLWNSCKENHQPLSTIHTQTLQIDSLIASDSTIITDVIPYKNKMIKEVNKILSYAPKDIVRTDGNLQSSLGNMLADLMFDEAQLFMEKEYGRKVDFVFSNYGGIRAGIYKGDVKVIHAFNLMPFDNTLVVAELTKEKTEELFEYFIVENKSHPLSEQVRIEIGKGDQINIQINGEPLKDGKTYLVATSNYLQKGGDNMNFFLNPVNLYESDLLIRDLITKYFKEKDTLVADLDKRVIIK